jgi:phosphoribosyl 1,2-cyclic phosphodiesterase
MLRQAQRHESVKRSALGRSGHLSNDDAAELLESALSPRLRAVFMAHLSLEGNTPTLAENALRKVLRNAGRDDVRILQTHPTTMSALLDLT